MIRLYDDHDGALLGAVIVRLFITKVEQLKREKGQTDRQTITIKFTLQTI